MLLRATLLLTFALPAVSADWNPTLAAQYLDSRQKAWLAWPYAIKGGAPCISCHTGVTYLLSRPALRRALGEAMPTSYETALIDGVRAQAGKKSGPDLRPDLKPSRHTDEIFGTNTVLAALLLAFDDAQAGRGMSSEAEQAFTRMWSTQVKSGPASGAWLWTQADLDPWEAPDSVFYGAALAALATGVAPGDYQSRPAIRENVAILTAYLREAQKGQPLHNRVALLWASRKLRHCVPESDRREILEAVRQHQAADGGWSLESLGAWKKRDSAPPAQGSSAYATAFTAFALQKAGVDRQDRTLTRALDWLRAHQDPQSGYWDAQSMNKRYEPGSMPIQFMRDATTGYASAALLDQ